MPDFGDLFCPTRDLLATAVRRYPFHTSSVMVARWVLLEAGPWEEELLHRSDQRYWLRLGLRGTRVIALRDELGTRRLRPGSLTTQRSARPPFRAAVFLMGTIDLLDRPERWSLLGPYLSWAARRSRQEILAEDVSPLVATWRGKLVDRIRALGPVWQPGALSPRLPLALIEHYLAGGGSGIDASAGFSARLRAAMRRVAR